MKSIATRRIVAAAAVLATASLALSACAGTADSASGQKVTLKLVAADYGTGPADTSQKYWEDVASAFHKANPSITVKVQTINWNDFDTQVQTMVQNKQYPDVTEGDYYTTYAKEGLLYP